MQGVHDEPSFTITADHSCTIVVPCYNEATRLQPSLFSDFIAHHSRVHFLFVNDGSRDHTLAVLEKFASSHSDHVHVLDLQPNCGKAEAVRVGMLTAIAHGRSSFVGYWDADLATPLAAVPHLLSRLRERPTREMVFGSRVRLLGHFIHRQPLRHYLGRAFATAASLVLRLPIYDTQCGAKLFRVTSELESVLTTPFASRWIFDVELIARFLALHRADRGWAATAIYESALPSWRDVAGSKVSPLDFFRAFGELMQIHKTYRFR